MSRKPIRNMVCLDPQGEPILSAQQVALLEQGASYVHREFEDERLRVRFFTHKQLTGISGVPQEHWKPFSVEAHNIITVDYEGRPFDDGPRYVIDFDASHDFRTWDEALKHYETFLARYSDSRFDETTGDFREVGNKLAPPDPDVPQVAEESPAAEQFGSW